VESIYRKKIIWLIEKCNEIGLRWKVGKDLFHLKKRIEVGHLPADFSIQDYENLILSIINALDSEIYIYSLARFQKDYFVFGDGIWVVIIGEDGIMETAFVVDGNYREYLSEEKGYQYLGTVKEVLGVE